MNFETERSFNESVLSPELMGFIESHIGNICFVGKASGGLVHHVYRLFDESGNSYYLKQRGHRFSEIPDLVINPKDIFYEKESLELFSSQMPDIFPHVVGFDSDQSAILMTDVNPSQKTLLKVFENNSVNLSLFGNLGRTLGEVHSKLAMISTSARSDRDVEQYETNLKFKLLRFNIPVLEDVAQQLRQMPKQLIVGDMSPKNIGINEDNSITMFDLESAHVGNSAFEVGYLLGHIVLHLANCPEKINESINIFFDGYCDQQPNFNSKDLIIIKKISAATILYRLKNEVIPYQTSLTETQKETLVRSSYNQLNFNN